MHTHTRTHTHTRAYTHTHTHTHTQTNTHTLDSALASRGLANGCRRFDSRPFKNLEK